MNILVKVARDLIGQLKRQDVALPKTMASP